MMTLDEAIAHARAVAEELKKQATIGLDSMEDTIRVERCKECAEDHEQLASWLEELKKYKSQKVIIKVKPQDANTLKKILRTSQFGIAYPDTQYEVVPMINGEYSKVERPQGEWIIIYSENNIKTCKCSECGRIEDIVDFSKYPFCHCGAAMRGGAE